LQPPAELAGGQIRGVNHDLVDEGTGGVGFDVDRLVSHHLGPAGVDQPGVQGVADRGDAFCEADGVAHHVVGGSLGQAQRRGNFGGGEALVVDHAGGVVVGAASRPQRDLGDRRQAHRRVVRFHAGGRLHVTDHVVSVEPHQVDLRQGLGERRAGSSLLQVVGKELTGRPPGRIGHMPVGRRVRGGHVREQPHVGIGVEVERAPQPVRGERRAPAGPRLVAGDAANGRLAQLM